VKTPSPYRSSEMPKLYYPSPDEVQGAEPLDELAWFEKYQHWLLQLANTNEGRDILFLPPWRTHPYPIVGLRKQVVRFYLGRWDGLEHWQSEFHIGAKWGNVIRYRWQEVRKAINQTVLRSILDYPPIYTKDGRLLHPVGGATTSLFYPDPSPESTTVDGTAYAYTGGAGATWAASRAANGYGSQDDSAVDDMGRLTATDGTTDRYHGFHRQFLLFNTSALGSGDTIDSGTVTLTSDATAIDSFGDDTVLTNTGSGPASPTAIDKDDYQAMVGAAAQSDTRIDVGAFVNSTHVYTLNAAGIATVTAARDGITKFGGRLSCDQDNINSGVGPTWVGGGQSTPRYYAAETSGTSSDPKLTVVHTSPFTPQAIMF
jgi:hypothetical protein